MRILTGMIGVAVMIAPAALAATAARTPAPAPECRAHVGYDRDADLPGYIVDGECVPFTATAVRPPTDYKGDFYVNAFTDARLAERWRLCAADSACRQKIDRQVVDRRPPNRDKAITDPHARWLLGMLPDRDPLDLALVRRPAFFAAAPWNEAIARLEPDTYTIEFSASAEPFERLILHSDHPVRLRGWYIRGAGVPDAAGHRRRALVIMSSGGGGRLVAIEAPDNQLYEMKDGKSVLHSFPDDRSGASGVRQWRQMMTRFHDAGFDVLCYDRRGIGLSTGYSDTNTLQQGRDLLDAVAALRTGRGMRVLTPRGTALAGKAAVGALLGAVRGDALPVVLMGSSRGTMATGWAMARNFDTACDYDLPGTPCRPPLRLGNIRGAIQFADFSAGPGYLTADTTSADSDRPLFIAGMQAAYHIVFFPNSAILAGVHRWPALFIGRGLFDYAESLEGAIDVYDRVQGLKELVVVRAPHALEVWPAAERDRVFGRAIAFATAASFGQPAAPGARAWRDMKELVASAGPDWEGSSRPVADVAAARDASH